MLRNTKVGVVKPCYGHTAGLIRDNLQQCLGNYLFQNDTPCVSVNLRWTTTPGTTSPTHHEQRVGF